MKVIEKYNDDRHNPQWKFQLGPETYEVRDTPKRVEVIKKVLADDDRFEAVTREPISRAADCPAPSLPRLHPKDRELCRRVRRSIPICFPARGAHLPKYADPLWGGIWCTDAVTPIMSRTYEVARAPPSAR